MIFEDKKLKPKGNGEIIIEYKDKIQIVEFENEVINNGRMAMAKSFANQFGAEYDYWISSIAFGSGGTSGGVPRYVEASRTGLWGPTVITKPVTAVVGPSVTSVVSFTSVLTSSDAVGEVINEMGLIMNNGDFFSLTTFGDINKTSSMQIIINWKLTFN